MSPMGSGGLSGPSNAQCVGWCVGIVCCVVYAYAANVVRCVAVVEVCGVVCRASVCEYVT